MYDPNLPEEMSEPQPATPEWLELVPVDVLGLLVEAVQGYWKTLPGNNRLREHFAGLGAALDQEIERRIKEKR